MGNRGQFNGRNNPPKFSRLGKVHTKTNSPVMEFQTEWLTEPITNWRGWHRR